MNITETTASPSLRLRLNVPNVVTASRVVLAAVIGYLLYLRQPETISAAAILLIVAALTDTADGIIARRMGQDTAAGALFDLVADELLFMPSLVLAIRAGLFARTDGLMPLNPYLYAVPALAGGVAVLTGIAVYLWKRRTRVFDFPSPPPVAKANYWFWLSPLVVAVLGIGPNMLLAVLMYLALISTILTFYSYLKKGSYVFTD